MAEGKVIFLSHTGGEMTLPVMNKAYGDPRILTLPWNVELPVLLLIVLADHIPVTGITRTTYLKCLKSFPISMVTIRLFAA